MTQNRWSMLWYISVCVAILILATLLFFIYHTSSPIKRMVMLISAFAMLIVQLFNEIHQDRDVIQGRSLAEVLNENEPITKFLPGELIFQLTALSAIAGAVFASFAPLLIILFSWYLEYLAAQIFGMMLGAVLMWSLARRIRQMHLLMVEIYKPQTMKLSWIEWQFWLGVKSLAALYVIFLFMVTAKVI